MQYPELIEKNNQSIWDWITWETLGNPDPKFQKGDIAMKFGLWRADYALLCRSENSAAHADGALGRGGIKIDVLPEFDYRPHKALIKTFLPFMEIDSQTGKLIDPISKETVNDAATGKYWVVMPYNYDDNSEESRAIGTKGTDGFRLVATLTRWSTASRSGIAQMAPSIDINTVYKKQKLRDKDWPYRKPIDNPANIFGPEIEKARNTTYTKTLTNENASSFYSVKTGVQYVGKDEQSKNNKDVLEANSLHAMKRSSLVASVQKNYIPDALKVRYQIEILCVQHWTMLRKLAGSNEDAKKIWDGFQVRNIGANPDEVWFPAQAIPGSGKAFAKYWGGTDDWVTFWTNNFAKPLGRAKAEMLAFFGFQHQTANAQNMLIAFNRKQPKAPSCFILRDLGDTLLNDHAYAVLNGVDPGFKAAWDFETNPNQQGGSTLTRPIGGSYADPMMTRVGATIVFFFPPFMQGNLAQGAAKTLATWGLALNQSFLDYFQDTVGYTASWQKVEKEEPLPPYEGKDFCHNAVLESSGAIAAVMKPADEYHKLKEYVLSLQSKHRQTLVAKIVELCNHHLHSNEPKTAANLVGMHDMLIGAEAECYLKSEAGKQNLRELHAKYRRKG